MSRRRSEQHPSRRFPAYIDANEQNSQIKDTALVGVPQNGKRQFENSPHRTGIHKYQIIRSQLLTTTEDGLGVFAYVLTDKETEGFVRIVCVELGSATDDHTISKQGNLGCLDPKVVIEDVEDGVLYAKKDREMCEICMVPLEKDHHSCCCLDESGSGKRTGCVHRAETMFPAPLLYVWGIQYSNECVGIRLLGCNELKLFLSRGCNPVNPEKVPVLQGKRKDVGGNSTSCDSSGLSHGCAIQAVAPHCVSSQGEEDKANEGCERCTRATPWLCNTCGAQFFLNNRSRNPPR